MKATRLLHDQGQSIWRDNISRDLLDRATLQRYIDDLSVTGLTSNPTISDHSIENGASSDAAIIEKRRLAGRLQDEGAKPLVKSWDELMGVIASKSASLDTHGVGAGA